MAFLTQNKATLCKNLIITLVFEKNSMCPLTTENFDDVAGNAFIKVLIMIICSF
jgi:hypothetical protein